MVVPKGGNVRFWLFLVTFFDVTYAATGSRRSRSNAEAKIPSDTKATERK